MSDYLAMFDLSKPTILRCVHFNSSSARDVNKHAKCTITSKARWGDDSCFVFERVTKPKEVVVLK